MQKHLFDRTGRVLVGAATVAIGLAAYSLFQIASPLPPALAHLESVDLGPHEFGATAIGRIELTNVGDSELVAGPFYTSCSCAGVEIERDGQFHRIDTLRIPARSRAEISVRIAVGVKPGSSQHVQVAFESNDPDRPKSAFDVHIPQVLGGVYPVPAAALFGDTTQEPTNFRDVFIYNNGTKTRKLESVRASHPERFEVEIVPPVPGVHEPQIHESAGQMIAVARVRPKAGWVGPLDGFFELTVSGETRPPDRVDVIGQILGTYSCTPDALALPRTIAGKPMYRCEMIFARRDGKPFSVVTDKFPDGIVAKIVPDPLDSARVTIEISCEPLEMHRTVRLRFLARTESDAPMSIDIPLLVAGKSP